MVVVPPAPAAGFDGPHAAVALDAFDAEVQDRYQPLFHQSRHRSVISELPEGVRSRQSSEVGQGEWVEDAVPLLRP